MTKPIAERVIHLSSRNPVVGEHRVYGNPVFPGMAYVDLIYQLSAPHGVDFRTHALGPLRIHRPLVVPPGEDGLSIRVRILPAGQDRYAVVVEDAGAAREDGRYASAELAPIRAGELGPVERDVSNWPGDGRVEAMSALYERCRESDLVHGGYMRAHGEILVDGEGVAARLALDPAAESDAERFLFHPALLDAAAIASRASAFAQDGDLYLPLVIESFVATAPITGPCLVRIPNDGIIARGEIVTMSLDFFSVDGVWLARIKGFSAKRVRDARAFEPRALSADAGRAPAPAKEQPVRPQPAADERTTSAVVASLRAMIAGKLRTDADEVALDKGYYELGLESSDLLDLVEAAGRMLGRELSPTLMFEYPTLAELDEFAAREASDGGRAERFVGAPPEAPQPNPAAPARFRFAAEEAYLQDHKVLGKLALMGVTHPCLAVEALAERDGAMAFPLALSHVRMEGGPITLEDGESVELSVEWSGEGDARRFEVSFARDGQRGGQVCCRGGVEARRAFASERRDIGALTAGLAPLSAAEIDAWYGRVAQFAVGPLLRTVCSAHTDGAGLLVSRVTLDEGARKGGRDRYAFDPLLLNSCFFIDPASNSGEPSPMYVPLMIERIELARPLPADVYLVNRMRVLRAGYAAFDVDILSMDGETIGRIVNASVRAVADPQAFANARFADVSRAEAADGSASRARGGDIAIIGLAGRYPDAPTLDQFWRNLSGGRDSIAEIPASRWDHARFFDPDKNAAGKTYSKWGGFLDDVDCFDPYYFGITPREAELMDPQERLFLQCAVHAIEDAGYTREGLARCAPARDGKSASVGVYVGLMYQEYQLYGAEQTQRGDAVALSGSAATVANRVSYFCNFTGPSMAVDTMCSSSLTALSLACRALERGDCAAALVGGVNLSLHPNKYLMLAQGRFASSRGRCEAFGKGGDGYVPGEGVGAVVLKSLARAEADGDHIYGVIRACEINHGGRSAGYSVPGVRAQSEVVSSAYQRAGVSPREVSYIEAHGTGTSLGDPIEIAALSSAFGESGDRQFCAIGSVKSNIGHCESAAGIAGLTKVLLQMRHRRLAPSLHADELNPAIAFERSPFSVQRSLTDWPAGPGGAPRIAGLSSFGAGGSNAHVVVEEHKPSTARREAPIGRLAVPLSAGSWEQLRELASAMAGRVGDWLAGEPDEEARRLLLADAASTLQLGREPHRFRLGIVATSLETLADQLSAFVAADPLDAAASAKLGELGIHAAEAKRGGALAELSAGDVELLVAAWVDENKTAELLRFWCRGGALDWRRLRAGRNAGGFEPRRVSLPGYPFAKERYWVPSLLGEPAGARQLETVPAPARPAAAARKAPVSAFDRLASALAEISGFPADKLDRDADFEALGLDSVMIAKLNLRIAGWTGETDAALLFKYKTLDALAAYLDARIVEPAYAGTDAGDEEAEPAISAPELVRGGGEEDAIAIVGMSGRYPQSETLDAFWSNLVGGVDCVTEIPRERFDYREIYRPDEKGKTDSIYCKWGGFLGDVSQFDAPFFNLPAQDAALMDPQERLFLESAWTCLEGAGYLGARWQSAPRNVGVFAGVSFNNYQLIGADALADRAPFYPAGSQTFSVANRVSFFFNFTGPSVAVDTACSSSLYALHLACESLWRGEVDAALAGGVNLTLHPSKYLTLCASSFAASDGRCHAFASGGDGYVPGEGVGAVLLKRRADAIKDGDRILALIRGTGVSHDGKTQGFTVPNPVSQTKAIQAALARAKVPAETVGYIEAHGTGTALGDPIEIQGLMDAYPAQPGLVRGLGSVKAGIGHGESAAGIAQLTKTVLQLQHRTLAPTVLHGPLNPDIPFGKAGFHVPQQAKDWPLIECNGQAQPRRAGISSFGAGGVNVHVIVEEVPALDAATAGEDDGQAHVLPLSAAAGSQLPEQARRLADFLEGEAGGRHSLREVAFTLQHRRPAFRHRLALVVRDAGDAVRQLRDWLAQPDAARSGGPYRGDSLDAAGKTLAAPDHADLSGCARAWAAGARFEWPGAASRPGELPRGRCAPLPTYPFATKRHWISDILPAASKPAAARPQPAKEIARSDDLDAWLMETDWEEVDAADERPAPRRIALCCDDETALRDWTQGWPAECVAIEPERGGGFGARLSEMLEAGDCEAFVFVLPHHRLSLPRAELDGGALEAAFRRQAERLAEWVARAVDASARRKGIRLALVNLTDRGEVDPIQEALSKYFSFLRFEVPELGSVAIDADSFDPLTLSRIGGELHCGQGDTRVRFADGRRLCQRLRPLPAGVGGVRRAFDASGTMIVTGGFGGIGFAVLEWLIDKGVKSLIVIGRKPVSAALRHPSLPNETTIDAFASELARTRGVALHYVQSDLSDEAALARRIGSLRERLAAPVTGVFHLAGVTTESIPIRETTAATLAELARPKLIGAHVLDRLTRDDPIRYFCLFSSISSVEGMQGNGLSAYGAANASLVAFAAARRNAGRRAQVVQWTDWDGAGMAVEHNHRAFFDALGMSMLTPKQGVQLLERIVADDIGEAIAFDADWDKYARVNRGVQRLPVFAHYAARLRKSGPNAGSAGPECPGLIGERAERGGADVAGLLLSELGALLGRDDLHLDQTFAEIGLDSINSLAFFSGLSERLAFEVLPSSIFRYPTIGGLASFIGENRGAPAGKAEPADGVAAPRGASESDADSGRIAIVGMAGQFPQADGLPAFWTRLMEGYDGVSHYPRARRDLLGLRDAFGDEELETVHGGYLDGIDLFDPGAFGISPREARLMDPQQRLLMLNARRAIEDAGIRGDAGFANTGVFLAQYASQYMQFANDYDKDNALFIATGNASSIAANRLSYHYGFNGPSLVLDTACSSTLVALDIACQYLRSGQIDFALVGGVSLNLNPRLTRLLQDAGMLSPTGRCHTFDRGADGYVPGEGVGMIVLQRLGDARSRRKRDPARKIYAAIAGTAINQDGKSNGMTAPNGLAQETVIRRAFERAGFEPSQAGYIETHGTGTYLGDPVEIEALGNVVNAGRDAGKPCVLGCLKTNIGHLEPAAGIASVIKAALCLHLETIPANRHLQTVNPLLKIAEPGFVFPSEPTRWSGPNRVAGVSSFGFGGVNGHVVLASVDDEPAGPDDGDRTRRFIDGYPPHGLAMKSYWIRVRDEAILAEAAATRTVSSQPAPMPAAEPFLGLVRVESPAEELRFDLALRPGEPGLADTGNFHVGFYLDAIYRIFTGHFGRARLNVRRFEFRVPLLISAHADTQVRIVVKDLGAAGYRVTFSYRPEAAGGSAWTTTAEASVDAAAEAPAQEPSERRMASILSGVAVPSRALDEDGFYRRYTEMGFPAHGHVRAVRECRFHDGFSLASLRLDFGREDYGLGAHPGFLDAALQPSILLADTDGRTPYMTTAMENIRLNGRLASGGDYRLVSILLPSAADAGARRFSTAWAVVDSDGDSVVACALAELLQLGGGNEAASSKLDSLFADGGAPSSAGLLAVVAGLLDCDAADIDLDKALLELGMDSLMLMKLQQQLDEQSLTVKNLFQATLRDLIVRLDGAVPPARIKPAAAPAEAETEGFAPFTALAPWSRERAAWVRGQARKQSRIRLYCFPYAHMPTTVFKGWQELMPDHVEVRPIELPGRGDRWRERPVQDVWTVASTLTQMLGDELDQPFAVYGHSAGALMAYVWSLHLRASGLPLPRHLFAAAFSAPGAGENPVIRDMRATYVRHGLPRMPTLDDICEPNAGPLIATLIDALEHSMREAGLFNFSRDLIHAQLPSLVATFEMVEAFRMQRVPPLPIPISALHGVQDIQVEESDVRAWRKLGNAGFELLRFEGNHLFMDSDQCMREVVSFVGGKLSEPSSAERRGQEPLIDHA
ncbi:hypothetical protein DK842_05865 [Chromobacterium phragmitis]|uniref:beta-ketoacyl synthase N-terminal-like domain-containing protein n=1 Tax=Chromobacterium phragmitis TaxID=2202141 RepID=UPI000DEC9184|nr:beta-ketoacyl synthase N-terminal-like domain-containing protein [Chromobacterium phragmitis]AXE29468.1 hypothetical protein DK842_05865 [Chromobacterium phragmitis]